MSDVTLSAPDRLAREPWFGFEARMPRHGMADRLWTWAGSYYVAATPRIRGRALRRIVAAVERAEVPLAALDDGALQRSARAAGRAAALDDPALLIHAAGLFAHVREAAARSMGMRHYPVQLMGGWAMMRGQLAEMATGEGKTLTATLAAASMALAGRPVHVITANDYLAERDSLEMTPVYACLGLSVGLIVQGMSVEERARAYRCDLTYCSNTEIAFDYLKDRVQAPDRRGALVRRVELGHGGRPQAGLLRGLAFALIDEADSVLIDEARTPLVLSGEGEANFDPELLRSAAAQTAGLTPADYRVDAQARQVSLTASGQRKLALMGLEGMLANRVIREELAIKYLTAQHLFHRGEHYLLRNGKVVIVDEYTGRAMPDRFWTDGLHQMIELKENVELSGGRVTLARTTCQRFFSRYDRVGGMTGTASEVSRELWQSYRMATVHIPTRRPVQRRSLPARIHRTDAAKWADIACRAARLQAEGRPVLIGTRSVAASEAVAEVLEAQGLDYQLLSAAQDEEEAMLITEAGQPGRLTVATNMAGRGADIKLTDDVREYGGLAVIMSEAHDSRRVDRQLAGRAGRQGDPGTFQPILSLEDALMVTFGRKRELWLARRLPWWRGPIMERAQARAEALHARMRRDLQRQEEVMNDAMAFAGVAD